MSSGYRFLFFIGVCDGGRRREQGKWTGRQMGKGKEKKKKTGKERRKVEERERGKKEKGDKQEAMFDKEG